MKRLIILGMFVCVPLGAWAQESWFSLFLGGSKVGWASSTERQATNRPGIKTRTESETLIRTALMDTAVDITIKTTTELDPEGRPRAMRFETNSGGRTQVVNATIAGSTISLLVNNNGQASRRTLTVPKGALLVDDATTAMTRSDKDLPVGKSLKVHVLDPTTLTLIENTVTKRGEVGTEVRGLYVRAQLIEIADPRATTRVFLSGDGGVLKVEGPIGLLMLPEPKEKALDMSGFGRADIGELTALRPDRPLENAESTRRATFHFAEVDLKGIPSDSYQTVKDGAITVHPLTDAAALEAKAKPLATVGMGREGSLRPSLHIPSNEKRFVDLARQIVGTETNSYRAAQLINRHVGRIMMTDASIGVLRNANEVLDTRRGVCRDYAILAATLMRAARIPTRVVSGLIYDGGQFYYHAWVECWIGDVWVPFDPTRAERAMDATRIKLNHGNVEEAFTFRVLTGAKIRLGEVQYR